MECCKKLSDGRIIAIFWNNVWKNVEGLHILQVDLQTLYLKDTKCAGEKFGEQFQNNKNSNFIFKILSKIKITAVENVNSCTICGANFVVFIPIVK